MAHDQVKDTLDTNLIVHYIIGDVPKQRALVSRLLAEEETVHLVPDLAITEAVYVFETHYNQSRRNIVANLRKFLEVHDRCLDYNRDLFELVFLYYESHSAQSFNDCCMAYYAELGHAEPLFTFDKKLVSQHPSAKLLR